MSFSIINQTSDENLQILLDESSSYRQILYKLGYRCNGSNYKTLYDRIKSDKIDLTKFNENKAARSKTIPSKKDLDELLVEESNIKSTNLKQRLYKSGLKSPICEWCGCDENWHGKKLTLQLDHINGNHLDNRIENLRILCPNCHSTTETFCRGQRTKMTKKERTQKQRERHDNHCTKCGVLIDRQAKTCISCNKESIKRFHITKEELYDRVWVKKEPFTKIGKDFGVSDNAIRKRCKVLGIEIRKIKTK